MKLFLTSYLAGTRGLTDTLLSETEPREIVLVPATASASVERVTRPGRLAGTATHTSLIQDGGSLGGVQAVIQEPRGHIAPVRCQRGMGLTIGRPGVGDRKPLLIIDGRRRFR